MKHPIEESLKDVSWTIMNGNNWPRAYDCSKKYGGPEECAASVSKNGDFEFHIHKVGQSFYLIKKQNASTLKMAGAPTQGKIEMFSDYYPLDENIYCVMKLMGAEHPSKRNVRTLDE